MKWEKIAKIEPAGSKPAICIAVSGTSRLYITNDCIVTHNTAGDPRNPLPEAYVDRNGRIKVLSTVPEENRKGAALTAQPLAQLPPDADAIYAPAPADLRAAGSRLADEMLARAGYLGSQHVNAEMFNTAGMGKWEKLLVENPVFDGLPIIDNDRTVNRDYRELPAFQGNKNYKLKQTLKLIRNAFPGTEGHKITHVIEGFGGGGSYMQSVILNLRANEGPFKNVKKLTIREFEGIRKHKIQYFHTRGDQFMKDMEETGLLPIIRELEEGVTSAGGVGPRLDEIKDTDERLLLIREKYENKIQENNGINIADALISSVIDFGKASFGTSIEEGKMMDMLSEDSADAKWRHDQILKAGVEVAWIQGSSFDNLGMDDSTFFSADPPYSHTTGYDNAGDFQTDGFWNAKGYREVLNMLQRAKESGASIYYDDEAWFLRPDAMGVVHKVPAKKSKDAAPKMFVPKGKKSKNAKKKKENPQGYLNDIPQALDIFRQIRSLFPEIVVMPVGGRMEIAATLNQTNKNHERGTNIGTNATEFTSAGYRAGIAERERQKINTEQRLSEAAAAGSNEAPAGSPVKSESASGSGAGVETQQNVLPPGTTPIPLGDAMPKDPGQVFTQAEWDSYDSDLGKQFTQQPLDLESQAAQIYRQIGEDEASYKFPYPPPTSKSLEEIAKAYAGEDVKIIEDGWDVKGIKFANGQGVVLMPGENGNYQVNASLTNDKRLTGNMGALGYQIAGTWAHNNGFKITSTGTLEPMNVLRRTSNMISNILRHDGETRQWMPNIDQQVDWTPGDNQANLKALLERESQIVLEKIPSLRSIFTDGNNLFARTPKGERPIPASRLLSSLAARFGKSDGIGEATIRRALLTKSIKYDVLRGRIQESLAVPAGDQTGRNDDSGSGSPAFTTERLLYSQSAYDHVNALAQRAYQETQAGGARTVGDPKRAYSMENEQWMGLDEYRKLNFQAQKESDWLKLAEKMLATDYVGTMRGLLAKFQVAESLLPWETKAAEKVIAAEMAKPLYGGPEQNSRREILYRLVLGLRNSRATTARTLAAMRDPHRSPEERLRAFAGDVIFTPSAATLKKASKFITEAEKDRRIAALESRLDALKPLAEKSQKQHAEIANLQKQLTETNRMGTQEQVIQQDLDERYDRVQARLRELGVTVEDLMGGSVEVRLLGAKVIADVADAFSPEERQIIALSQNKVGGNMADIARRLGISVANVKDVQRRYYDALKADLTKKFKPKGMKMKDLMLAGVDSVLEKKSLKSNPMGKDERSNLEAEEMAEQALRAMGFIDPDAYDATIVRSKKTKKVKPAPGPKDTVALEPWSFPGGPGKPVTDMLKPTDPEWKRPTGEGKPVEVLIAEAKKKGIVWKDAPTGEGKPVDEMLKPTTPEWQRPTGEGRTTDTGRLDLDEGPWEHTRFNFDDAAQRLQAMRLIQSAAHGATGWDYASEILVANLLSAPTTAVTNITGYLYGLYRFTIRRAIEAAMNFGGSSEAATFGEFRPMMAALSRNLGTAFTNAITAWQTETPITEALRNNSQQKLGMQFDEPLGKIPGKFGRFVRMPMRFLLATDEFAKTILAHTHAATVAHRLGRAQGFDGKRLASFINGQLGDPTSVVWEKALQEARHVTFQDKLRTFTEMDAQEMGAFDRIINSPEGIAAQLMRYKNAAGPDAGLIHNIAAFGLRAVFPFIKTPLNLLKIGIHESFLGGILEAMRTGGGVGVRARQKNKQTGEWEYGAKDMGAAVNARAAILTSAIITAILSAAGEGDDDDDSKWLLVTGTTPQKDPKAQGIRELHNRTIPEQTIVFRIGGENVMFSYRRLDPFSTWIATTVDTLSSIKQAKKGKSGWEAVTRFNNSLMSQVLDKASLRGFSQVAGLILGGKPPTTQDVLNTAAAWTVPNAIRNPARNSDPLLRDTDFIAGDVAAQLKYAALPTANNAPPARLDLYGKPIEQRGNFFTRAFLPGQPSSVNAFAKEDVTLTNWNLQNPGAPFAPETPDTKAIIKRYGITPETAARFMRARGEYIATQMRANGLSGLKRPTAEQIDQIEKIVGKSTDAARKRVLGK